MGKCSEGDCTFLQPLTCELCCFECNDRDRCKFSCVEYDEDKDYEYSKCDKYIRDTKTQIIRDYANEIYIEFCEMQMTEEKITLKDIAEVLKIDFKKGDS